MLQRKSFVALLVPCAVAVTAATAHAQTKTYEVQGGVRLQARAYADYSGSLKDASRYDIKIVGTPKNGTNWDFTLENDPSYHSVWENGATYPTTYHNKSTAILRPTLHQYAVYEERITFRNLDVVPSYPNKLRFDFENKVTPRALLIQEPVTLTTPSGIAVTLPAQDASTLEEVLRNFNGNANALFLKIKVSPNQRKVTLDNSPLYRKYYKPVSIKLETPAPNFMVWYGADNTFEKLAIGLPNLRTLVKLDALTLIVRQRVDLQTIPIAIEVPIERPTKKR